MTTTRQALQSLLSPKPTTPTANKREATEGASPLQTKKPRLRLLITPEQRDKLQQVAKEEEKPKRKCDEQARKDLAPQITSAHTENCPLEECASCRKMFRKPEEDDESEDEESWPLCSDCSDFTQCTGCSTWREREKITSCAESDCPQPICVDSDECCGRCEQCGKAYCQDCVEDFEKKKCQECLADNWCRYPLSQHG